MTPASNDILVRPLVPMDYSQALDAMRRFTAQRDSETRDEIWLVEHPPVYTLGLASRREHLLAVGHIPVVQTERGGQVTYHGPGQLIAYVLLDLRRRGVMVRELVCLLESATIDTLASFGIGGVRKPGAPGIYVTDSAGQPGAKIAALGLKISRGASYHGLSLNVDMDLEPFSRIDPCGFPGLAVTDMAHHKSGEAVAMPLPRVAHVLAERLVALLTAHKPGGAAACRPS